MNSQFNSQTARKMFQNRPRKFGRERFKVISVSSYETFEIPKYQKLTLNAADVADAVNSFGCSLLPLVSSSVLIHENVLFSPWAASTALAMVYAGANGQTAEQMERALGWQKLKSSIGGGGIHLYMAKLKGSLQKIYSGQVKVGIYNRLWVQSGCTLNNGFSSILRRFYGTKAGMLNFALDPQVAGQIMNNWIGETSGQTILKVVQEEHFTSSTRVVITSAVHFKAYWKNRFDSLNTQILPFHINQTQLVETPIMYLKARKNTETNIRYYDHPDYQIAILPFAEDTLSLLIALPRDTDGLQRLEDSLDEKPSVMQYWMEAKPATTDMHIFLPKFRLACSVNLEKMLARLGVKDLFCRMSDLSGMSEANGLFLSAVIQKTLIEVGEEGAEPPIVPQSGRMGRTTSSKSTTFCADHPFLFFVVDPQSKILLLSGKLVNPAEPENSTEL